MVEKLIPNSAFLVIYFSFFAFLGWIIECVFCFISEKELVNRGFLYGPFVPLYGFGALSVLAISHYASPLPILIIVALCTVFITLLEYISSFILEKYFSLRLWDYSDNAFNLKGRVCLKFSLFWMIMIFIQIIFLQHYTAELIHAINLKYQYVIASFLVIYFVIDFIYSSHSLLHFSKNFTLSFIFDRYFKLPQFNVKTNIKTKIEIFLRPFSQFPHLSKLLYNKMKTFPESSLILDKWIATIIQKNNVPDDLHECFLALSYDIIKHPEYQRLKDFPHHDKNIYEHCLDVAWLSCKAAKVLNLDIESTIRGALLHDFFLYNWRDKNDAPNKLHGFFHARDAYLNAIKYFGPLSPIEKDIILKHMWPLTPIPPKYPESFIVCMIDTIVATKEFGEKMSEKIRKLSPDGKN